MPTILENVPIFQSYATYGLTRLVAGGPLVYRETSSGTNQKVVSQFKRSYTSVSTRPCLMGSLRCGQLIQNRRMSIYVEVVFSRSLITTRDGLVVIIGQYIVPVIIR